MEENKLHLKATKRRVSAAKSLRNQSIVAGAMAGKKTSDIALEAGLSRNQVWKILSSDEVKAQIEQIQSRLAGGVEDALNTVLTAVQCDYQAAYDLLKNFGAYQTKVELTADPTLSELLSSTWRPAPDEDVGKFPTPTAPKKGT